MSLVFGSEELERLLPFRVTCDAGCVVVGLGRSVERILGPDARGVGFFDLFTVVRPTSAGREQVVTSLPTIPWLVRSHAGLVLRGQWVRAEADGQPRLVFTGTPFIESIDDLKALGLSLRDLAAHDPIVEQLFRVQAQRAHLRDLEELSQRLTAAREAAEAASRAKTRFLANVSHELRTPLHIVLGFAELLTDDDLPEDGRRAHLAAIRSNGQTLHRIVDDLVDLARIEEGRIELAPRPILLDELLADVVLGLDGRARAKGLHLALTPSGWGGGFLLDPVRLRQILQNLVDNGIKYTPAGTVTLAATVRSSANGLAHLVIRVDDTGIGIGDDGHLLFEPFMRLARGRHVGGTGLGLALSRRIARAMGGELSYEPLPHGSRFVLELTVPEAGPVAAAPTAPRALLVGENPALLRLARTFLERAGHAVTLAADGARAVEATEGGSFAVVVTEPRLVDMDALALVRRLAAQPLVIIVLPTNETHRAALAAAGAHVLDAPVRAASLLELLPTAHRGAAPRVSPPG